MTFRRKTSAPAAGRRTLTFFVVALLHAGLIFGPLCFIDLLNRRKPKENMFRVKIGAAELSSGPEVGMPERIPPRPAPPPEPFVPAPPRPKPPAEPRIPAAKPKPKPKPRPKTKKPTPKPKPKTKPKKKRVVKPRPEPKVPVKRPVVKKRPVRKPPVRKKTVNPRRRSAMDDVYRPPQPANLNPKVPVGSRNRAQKYAPKANNKAPGGGRKVDEKLWVQYGRNVERYIYSRWVEPPRSLLGGAFPETLLEITVEANGRVSSARVVRSSGNRSMEASVQALLSGLDLLPRPPEGSITFRITLKTR